MVGSTVKKEFISKDLDIREVPREITKFESLHLDTSILNQNIADISPDCIVNLSGITRQRIQSGTKEEEAFYANVLLPRALDAYGEKNTIPIISLATDCVFSGRKGRYTEKDQKDGNDVYSISKILMEEVTPNTLHLRTSVVGLGNPNGLSLFEWFSNLESNSVISGFANHYWNGITSKVLAEILLGILNHRIEPGTIHIVPEGRLTKYEMLKILKEVINRHDVKINLSEDKETIDRTLSTIYPDLNSRIWKSAGYKQPPTSKRLLLERMI